MTIKKVNIKDMQKTFISTKEAMQAAREYFRVKRYRGEHHIMGGNNPYHLFIYKGEAFEIR